MAKSIFILILSLLLFKTAFTQKRDTVVYYLKSDGKVVSSKDSADFFLVILPPDTSVDKNLFVVNEFYRNGKTRLMGNSKTNTLDLKFQGAQVSYFPNGHKMRFETFENGEPIGDAMEYYPNGKVYNIKHYQSNQKVYLKQLNDSTGNALTINGKGKWTEYSEDFKDIYSQGTVQDGVEEGHWHGKIDDSTDVENVFEKGKLMSTLNTYKYKPGGMTYTVVETMPSFQGGIAEFGRYLARTIRYSADARERNIQGRVIISFIVERNGTLSDFKIEHGIGGGCDEEALRVMKLSPPWNPGIQNGKPVRVAYSVPISFTLAN